MLPTLGNPSVHLVWLLAYPQTNVYSSIPKRGDLILYEHGGVRLGKRVIGLPNETVEIRQGVVWVNQQPLQEDYVVYNNHEDLPLVQLASDQVFLMGDNRQTSIDSRHLGPLYVQGVRGRVLVTPWDDAFTRIGFPERAFVSPSR